MPDFTLDFALHGNITEAIGDAVVSAVAAEGFTVTALDDQEGLGLPDPSYLFTVDLDSPVDDILYAVRSAALRDILIDCAIFMHAEEPRLVVDVYAERVPGTGLC